MKIVVNKSITKEIKIKEGDIISLGNPYSTTHYLLTGHCMYDTISAINLIKGKIEYSIDKEGGFKELIRLILKEHDWDEWTLIKSENVTLTLDCKDGAIEQRNQSSPEFSSIKRQSVDELF